MYVTYIHTYIPVMLRCVRDGDDEGRGAFVVCLLPFLSLSFSLLSWILFFCLCFVSVTPDGLTAEGTGLVCRNGGIMYLTYVLDNSPVRSAPYLLGGKKAGYVGMELDSSSP